MFTASQDITLTVRGHALLNPYDCTYLQGLYLPVQQALDVPCHLLHQLLRLILLHLKQIPVVFVDLEGSRSQASGQGRLTFPRHCPSCTARSSAHPHSTLVLARERVEVWELGAVLAWAWRKGTVMGATVCTACGW